MNKNMKSILLWISALALMLTAVIALSVDANADETVDSIGFIPQTGQIKLIENVGGEEDDGNFIYSYDPFRVGTSLIVNLTDGTEKVYKYRWLDEYDSYVYVNRENPEDLIFCSEIDGVFCEHNQYDKPWIRGSDNNLIIKYSGKECSVPVTVVENTVQSIEFNPASEVLHYIENAEGEHETDDDGNSYFWYATYPFEENTSLVVTTADSTKTYVYTWLETGDDDWYDCYINQDDPDDIIPIVDYSNGLAWFTNQDEAHWTLGSDNQMEIQYSGQSYYVPVTIDPNPVESINFIPGQEIKLIKDVDVSFTTQAGTTTAEINYAAATIDKISENAQIEVTYSADHTTKIFTYDSTKRAFVNGDKEYDVDDWVWYYAQDAENWKVGPGNKLGVSFYWKECSVEVTVVDTNTPDNVANVKALIDNLNEKDADYAAKVKAAKAAFDALTKEEKEQLDQASITKLNEAVAKVEKDEADKKQAKEEAPKKKAAEEPAASAKNPVIALNVIDTAIVLKKGASKTVTVEVTEKDASKVTTDVANLTSSKANIASASGSNLSKGKLTFSVKGLKKGNSVITVKLGSVSAKVNVTVLDKANKVKAVKASKKTVKAKKGKTVTVTFKVTGKNKKFAVTDKVSASSSKKGIAAIKNIATKKGKVTVNVKAIKKGKSTLKLKVGGKTAKVKINVK